MSTVSHDDIVGLLGDIDDLLAERLVETGASLDEILEAWGDLQADRRLGEPRVHALSPRVTEVRSILAEVSDDIDGDGEDDGRGAIVHDG